MEGISQMWKEPRETLLMIWLSSQWRRRQNSQAPVLRLPWCLWHLEPHPQSHLICLEEVSSLASHFYFLLWGRWKARNEVVFRGREKEQFLTVRRGRENALDTRVLTKHGGVEKALSRWIRWTLPSPIWVKLNTSSSAKKSMGMAFVGGKLQDCEGN